MLEDRRLDELEAVIERGLTTFVEVGNAIREIRDSKLYLESHQTFEKYCRERWGWSRNYANKHVSAADTAALVGTTVPIQNERVARELSPLKGDPETMNRVWGGVVEEYGESPAAKHVRNAVDQAKTAERIRAQLPPATRTVVEGIDPDDCNLPNEPKQLTHLLDASLKHGDEQTAKTAERVGNGEFKSTFDAYPEVRTEAAEEPIILPDKTPTPAERAGFKSLDFFRALTKHDPKEAASVHNNRLDPTAVQDEIGRAQEATRWLEEYTAELKKRTGLRVVGKEDRVG